MDWTGEQQAAISARNSAILVSAAAGSGKTAVLVERVVSLIRYGIPIQQMLIVTFTRAAASEMRERIEKRLRNDPEPTVRLQAPMARQATIATLHSFCQKYLREHFAAAGVDPMFRMGSESELNPLRSKAVEEALNQAWLNRTEESGELFRQFEFEELEEIIPMLQRFRSGLEIGRDPISVMTASGFTPFHQELKDAFYHRILGAEKLLGSMEKLLRQPGAPVRYQDTWEQDALLVQSLEKENPSVSPKLTFAQLTRKHAPEDENPDLTEQYKSRRDHWKKRRTS